MGELARSYAPALVAWGMLLWLRPGPAPGRRLVRLCVLGLAVSQTALTPVVITFTLTAGLHSVERLIGHLAMLTAAWAGGQILLRLHGYGTRARAHTAWAVLAGAVMCLLFALTPNLYPQSPWVMEYCIAYAVALLPEFTVIARLCLRDALKAPDRTLRAGLCLVVAGIGGAACYMTSKTVVAISARVPVDFPLGRSFMMSKVLPTTAHLLVLIGVAMPAIAAWSRRYRRYRRLGPLWFALYRAEPSIALEPPGLLRGNTLFPTRLRLYRRVIEIRDGLLAIRPYLPADAPPRSGLDDDGREAAGQEATGQEAAGQDATGQEAAGQEATGQEATGQEAAGIAAAIATGIAAALRAREKGTPPRSARITVLSGHAGGHDLGSDTEYLCRLSDAYRTLTKADRRGAKG